MFLNTTVYEMFRCCLKLFKQTKSRYISWNILFLWGFGLWIALCTSNTYYSGIFQDQATLFYLQNSTFGIKYNISIKTEAIEDMLYITTTNYTTYNFILVLKAILQFVHVFISTSFIIILVYLREYLKKVTKIWINMICDFCTVASFFTISPKYCKKYEILSKIENENDYTISKSELGVNSGITVEHSERKSHYNNKGDEWALEQRNRNITSVYVHIVQNEIIFNNYTLLLLNNCELRQYFINQLVKNHLLNNKYLVQSLKYTKYDTRTSKNDKGNDQFLTEKVLQKGIISSSPEFQTFLANFKTTNRSKAFLSMRVRSIYKLYYSCKINLDSHFI